MQAEPKPDSAEASSSGRPFYTDECTAFVRGLPQNIADGELDELFDDCGGLKEIRITRDSQTGQAKVEIPDMSLTSHVASTHLKSHEFCKMAVEFDWLSTCERSLACHVQSGVTWWCMLAGFCVCRV